MSLIRLSETWFRLLQRLYPPDFRDEMGDAAVEAYLDRARDALRRGGNLQLAAVCLRALADGLRNGLAERARPAAAWRRAGNWGRDVELVRRRLVRSPLFTATAVATLTVGLAMFAVVYTAVQRVLLDPLPYKNPADLYYVWRDYSTVLDIKRGSLSGPDIAELQRADSVIEGAAGLQPFLGGIFALREGAEPFEIAVTRATTNLFDVLGVDPAIGRGFLPGEAVPGRGEVIVLTHHLWKRLGADPGIVGTDVRLQGRPRRVVGVLRPDFSFVRSEAAGAPSRVDAFIPFDTILEKADARAGGFSGFIRARRGSTPAAVVSAVDAVGRVLDARYFSGKGVRLYPVALKADIIARIRPALLVLGAAGFVLVFMLMVNLASVLLARAAQRTHEVAVSRALGANTTAIARATLLEGAALGLAGGSLGALAAVWGAQALVALAPLDLPRREAIAIDWRIALTVILVGALLGLLAAAAPAAWSARTSLSSLLAGSAVRGGGGNGRWRRGLIVMQVALSFVLLAAGALVTRSFERLLRADAGFHPDGVLTFRMRTPPEFYPKISDAIAFHDRIHQTLAALPGVTAAGAASTLPLTATAFQAPVSFPSSPANTGNAERDVTLADLLTVRANYVETMGIRLLDGRAFTPPRPNGVAEVLIDSNLARRFFPNGSPVGATLRFGDRAFTVIGVIAQPRLYDIHADGRPQIFIRAEDFGVRPLFWVVRATREPRALLPEVRAALRRLDPRIPLGDDRTMNEIVDASLSPQSMGAALIGAFAAGALLLAAMGLFGVVSGSVTRRRHELAVRLALGADHPRVLRLVLKEGAVLAVIGLLIGAPGIYIATPLIRGLLVGVSPFDPITLTAAGLGLLLVTVAACYLPARRTLQIDPAQSLRQE